MQHLSSKLIHGDITLNPDNSQFRTLKTPVYETAAFDFPTAEDVEKAFKGESDAFYYSRISNPTVKELEDRLILFSGASRAICVSSGMAAISNIFLTLCSYGDNIITSKYLFGNTWSFFAKTLKSFGVEARFTNLEDPDAIRHNIDKNTRAIFMEILTNPQLIIFDFEAISEIASKYEIPLIVDNSALTPYIFQSKDLQIDIELFSNTKFISGGATSIGGTILTYPGNKWKRIPKLHEQYQKFGEDAFYKRLHKEIYRNIGACLSPNSAYLQILGLETITLRIDKICDNTSKVAQFLKNHPKTNLVNYASLPDSTYHSLAKKYLRNKAGCLIGFELGSKSECYSFMNSLKMIRRGTNFCDNKSMIIHPASTIFWDLSAKDKSDMQINDNLLRLSVGLEDIDDICCDIDQALGRG